MHFARLTHGLDFKGNVCGDKHANPDLSGLQVRYWVNPNQVYQSGLKESQFKIEDARSICLKNCPVASEDSLKWVCDYPEGDIHLSVKEWVHRNYDYFDFLTPEMRNASLQLQGPCYPVILPTVDVFWSCQYIARPSNVSLKQWQQMGGVAISEDILVDKSIHKFINSRSSVLKRYVADIGKTWPVLIVCGGIVPLFFSVFWLLMIRHFVSGMTWITVFFFNVLIISFMILKIRNGINSVFAKITVARLLLLAVKDSAGWIGNDAISPIIGKHDPYYHLSGRCPLIDCHYQAHPYGDICAEGNSGQVVQNNCKSNCCAYDLGSKRVSCDHCCGYSIRYTPHIGFSIAFHLFGCYWATQFFIACSSTIVAGSVASYYWGHGEPMKDIPFLPVFSSMKRLMRYSLGSVAIGSLIVLLIESSRCVLKSIRRKLKISSSRSENWFGNAASISSQCSLSCIEWTIKSVNRNAYIMIAITGKSFFTASAIATELIRNNILRIGKVNVIGDVILFLGKLCVSLSSVVFAFLMLDTYRYKSAHNKVSSPLFPVLVCWALSYVVATLFFAVVEMSIDTIILSFCQDSEEHQGHAQYAPPLLIETLNDQNEMQRLTQ
ncbi:plasma-membrane choline transporter family protein [Actinidia rufa]|uniref:Choline transporter-like protein n=1 Tax=Actinidia rufa TaxID=165716 RepID=A0A7J0FWI9_9ERIC|nr:plasma-membrane choline transporter family protein [Actinidia rufa]